MTDLASKVELSDISEVGSEWIKKNFKVTLEMVTHLQEQITELSARIEDLSKSSNGATREITELRDDIQQIQRVIKRIEGMTSQEDLVVDEKEGQ